MNLDGITAPTGVKHLLKEFVRSFQEYLGERLTGVYLHGSLAMGCFNPVSSDIDLLVVVENPLSLAEKTELGQRLLYLSTLNPANGMEMSIVTLPALQAFRHPCPYELHFSDHNKPDFISGRVDFSGEKLDPDLAAHFTITRARGICLYGQPITGVFPAVPKAAYLDSIILDTDESYTNVQEGADEGEGRVPPYAVLNFCRVLAFLEQGLVASKAEGGRWGLAHLPEQYHPIIQAALDEYTASGSARLVDLKLLKQFGQYAHAVIHRLANHP